MQTILGSSGIIGKGIAKELYQNYTKEIRLVARNPKQVNPTDQLFKADLLNRDQVMEAVKGSEVVYLTVGIQYNIKVWREQWPVIMRNVLDACIENKSRLVFFDNVYTYGKVEGWMTEETPYNPCSKKGLNRLKVINMMMDEVKKGTLQALIARAADFYGPDSPLSMINIMIFQNLMKGKKAQLMGNPNVKHSLTYTPDAGKATAILGNTPSAFNQVWHMPTDKNALTPKEIVELTAKTVGAKPSYTAFSKWMIRIVGLFMPVLKESVEMFYQFDSSYLFDSSKIEKELGIKPTSYESGIKETVKSLRNPR